MKLANILSILLATVLGVISLQWIFSPEAAAQSLSMIYMEGDARNTQVRDFTAFFLGTSIMSILSFLTKQYQWIFSAGIIFLIAAIFNVFTRLNDTSHRYIASGQASGDLTFSSTGSWEGVLNISEADKASANADVKNWNASFNFSSTDANFIQNFSCADVNASSICSGVRGSLYGTSNNIEMGAQFKYTVENLNSIYMAEGISILSE